ncbi:hypothetical protein VmeM32_00031 [Vibrio phage vB_VmeM-32]|nr:hypothetical protein VmeM32_00031 [Vibrio phage vB_VmeM-32]
MRNFIKYLPENVRMLVSVNSHDTIDLVSIEFRASNLNAWTECACLSFVGSEKCVTTHFVFDTMNINQLTYVSLASNIANMIHGQLLSNVDIDGLEEVNND